MPQDGPTTLALRGKRGKKSKLKQQNIVADPNGIFLADRDPSIYTDKDVLLIDEVYDRPIPKAAKGKLFHYRVTEYDDTKKHFTANIVTEN